MIKKKNNIYPHLTVNKPSQEAITAATLLDMLSTSSCMATRGFFRSTWRRQVSSFTSFGRLSQMFEWFGLGGCTP